MIKKHKSSLEENLKKDSSIRKDTKYNKIDEYSELNIIREHINARKLILNFEMQHHKNFMIHPDQFFYKIYNLFLSFVLLILIVLIPIEINEAVRLESIENYFMLILFFEWLFVVDIITNFVTIVEDEQGFEIIKMEKIAITQLKSWFVIDLISSIPINFIFLMGFLPQEISENNNNNLNMYIKLLKLPKYLRYINIMQKLAKSNIGDMLMEVLDFIGAQDVAHKQSKFVLVLILYFLANHIFCSVQISLVDLTPQSNWFRRAMESEFLLSLEDPTNQHHLTAHAMGDFDRFYEWVVNEDFDARFYQLYSQAWYFTLQTFTSVGQGDISMYGWGEKSITLLLMVLGTIFDTILNASIFELVLQETLENPEIKDRKDKIEKIIGKYNFRNEPRKALELLSDSLYQMNLSDEHQFISYLPTQQRNIVFYKIHDIFKQKIWILRDSSFELFLDMQQAAKKRKSIENEIIINMDEEVTSIYMVFNGRLGKRVPNIELILENPYAIISQSKDFGYISMINEVSSVYTVYCLTESEFIVIDRDRWVDIIVKTGHSSMSTHVITKVVALLVEFFVLLTFSTNMIKLGLQVDLNWYNHTKSLLKLNDSTTEQLELIENICTQLNDVFKFKQRMTFIERVFDQSTDKIAEELWYESYIKKDFLREIIKQCQSITPIVMNEKIWNKLSSSMRQI